MFEKKIKISVTEYEEMKAEIERLRTMIKEGDINQDIHFDCYNERAFWKDFKENFGEYPLVLTAFNINVEKVNEKYGREAGTKVIAEIVKQLKDKGVSVYHIQGEKFNIFYKQWEGEKLQNLWDLEMNEEYEVSVYVGEVKSMDYKDKDISAEELKDIAVKKMYEDKRIKRPKNKNILRVEEENRRLEELVESNQKLIEQLESFDEKNEKAKQKAVSLQNDKSISALSDIAKLMQKKQEEEEKKNYLAKCERKKLIPYTERFTDEGNERPLSTFWYSRSEYRYEVGGEVHKNDIYVFPLAFTGVEKSLDILVVIENEGETLFTKGNMPEYGFNTIKVVFSARFSADGKFITNIAFPKKANIISKKTETFGEKATPDKFGKIIDGCEFFPLHKGMNGYCEGILCRDDKLSHIQGIMENDSEITTIGITDSAVYIEKRRK